MNLPVRIAPAPPDEPVLSVDGCWGARGLELSHWPGNQTPPDLRHELSTGSVLAFLRLPEAERQRRTRGLGAIANHHYDTDGTCALYALQHPAEALQREAALLAAAAAGDFFQAPSRNALAVDELVRAAADPRRSPIAAELRGLDDAARWTRASAWSVEHLTGWLDGDLEPWRDLWQPFVERQARDAEALSRAHRDDLVHLDWSVWTAAAPDAAGFDPGRHALFARADAPDRVLAVAPRDGGWTYRFIVGTRSWFDLPGLAPRPRPRLSQVAAALDRLEGSDPSDPAAWRAQPEESASPELWFGAAERPLFAEHAPELRPSRLEPAVVRAALADGLRAALDLPA